MVKPRILILRAAGTNCDRETEWAFRLAGATPERIHINLLKSGAKKLRDYQILVIPGGFSYGDDISAGKALANELMHNLGEDIDTFISEQKPVFGICNGFQVLVKSGLLPWKGRQSVTLAWNDSSTFEDRWVYLKIQESVSPFFDGMPPIIRLPVAHAEGKMITADRGVYNKLQSQRLAVLRYCDRAGHEAAYPLNPSGSEGNIAALSSRDGLILGMMPHPERAILMYQYPEYPKKAPYKKGDGYRIIRNMVKYAT